MTTTKEQIAASLMAVKAVAEAIRELKRVPSGTLYAQVMGVMDLATYERIVLIQALQLNNFSRTLTAASLGIRRNHLYQRMKILKINLSEIPSSPGRPRKKVLDLKV